MLRRNKPTLAIVPTADELEQALAGALIGISSEFAPPAPIEPKPAPVRPIDVERAIVGDDIAALETKLAASRAEIARLTELAEQGPSSPASAGISPLSTHTKPPGFRQWQRSR